MNYFRCPLHDNLNTLADNAKDLPKAPLVPQNPAKVSPYRAQASPRYRTSLAKVPKDIPENSPYQCQESMWIPSDLSPVLIYLRFAHHAFRIGSHRSILHRAEAFQLLSDKDLQAHRRSLGLSTIGVSHGRFRGYCQKIGLDIGRHC